MSWVIYLNFLFAGKGFLSELLFNRIIHWLLVLVYIENRLQEFEIERVSI
jgi:hypothetical protein